MREVVLTWCVKVKTAAAKHAHALRRRRPRQLALIERAESTLARQHVPLEREGSDSVQSCSDITARVDRRELQPCIGHNAAPQLPPIANLASAVYQLFMLMRVLFFVMLLPLQVLMIVEAVMSIVMAPFTSIILVLKSFVPIGREAQNARAME